MKKILISLGCIIIIAAVVILFVNARSSSPKAEKAATCCPQGASETKACPMEAEKTPSCPGMAACKGASTK